VTEGLRTSSESYVHGIRLEEKAVNTNHTSDEGTAQRNLNGPHNRVAEVLEAKRPSDAKQRYARLVKIIKDLVQLTIPNESTLLVISKGDDELLDLRGRLAWHFPRAVNGKFAGCYPANSAEAIEHLEQLRNQGADHLLIPSTSFWWLEFYTDFTAHLQQKYRITTFQEEVCLIYRI
jgi:hypothetical protein